MMIFYVNINIPLLLYALAAKVNNCFTLIVARAAPTTCFAYMHAALCARILKDTKILEYP